MILAYLLSMALSIPAMAQSVAPDDNVFVIPNPKDCGLITRLSPAQIPAGCLQDVKNAYYDFDGTLLRRDGYTAYNLTACTGAQSIRGVWPFNSTDGTKYLIAYSSQSMFFSSGDGNCNQINGLSGLSSTADMECTQAMGRIWCTNGTDSVFSWDGTSTQTISGAPLGTHIGSFRNRILVAGVSGNLTQLYLSKEFDGTTWGLNLFPNNSNDPAIIDISGANDGLKINCLMGEYQNQFLIGRDYDLYALAGYDNRDFTMRRISEQLGCIEPKSVQEVNNVLYWVSKRGVEALSGSRIDPVSYFVYPTVKQIISASGNTRSQLFKTQSDWQNGNLTASGSGAAMSATISPGNVVPSSWSVVENTTNTWSLGTFLNVSTAPGTVVLRQGATASFINAGAESGDFTNAPYAGCSPQFISVSDTSMYGNRVWSSTNTGANPPTNFCSPGPASIKFEIRDPSSLAVQLSTSITLSANMGVTTLSIDTSSIPLSAAKLFVSQPLGGGFVCYRSVPFILGTGMIFKYKTDSNCSSFFDIDETNMITSGTYTTKRYDTSFSTPTWGLFNASVSSPANTGITFQTQVSSTSGGVLDSPLSASLGSKIGSAQKEFIVSVASFSVNSTTNTPPSLSSLSMSAETTGYYITSCITVSTPSSWGNLNVNGVNNGGSFTFYMSTGANCALATATTAPWVQQSPGAQITVSTATTATAVRVLFTIDVGTEVPTLNNITVNWNTGSNRPPVASGQYLDRYYLFYTTNTLGSPKNDHALVYDYNQKWTLLEDINAYSAATYLNSLYLGDSAATGKIYQFDTGESDNGGSYTFSFKTGDMDMGNPSQLKQFERAYMYLSAASQSGQNVSLACSYNIDGSTTSYSLGSVNLNEAAEQSGYFNAKLPFPIGTTSLAHWISMSCTYTGTDGPVRIHGMRLIYKNLSWD